MFICSIYIFYMAENDHMQRFLKFISHSHVSRFIAVWWMTLKRMGKEPKPKIDHENLEQEFFYQVGTEWYQETIITIAAWKKLSLQCRYCFRCKNFLLSQPAGNTKKNFIFCLYLYVINVNSISIRANIEHYYGYGYNKTPKFSTGSATEAQKQSS